jgi:tripartite-type tricarboxylate transporter receptor subunit TctC
MKRWIKNYLGFGVFCLSAFICFATVAKATDPEYPTRPIEVVVTYGAGGTTDVTFRALCEAANKYLPQPFIVINKTGASGVIGTTYIKNAKPDGYTIGSLTMSAAFVVPFNQDTPYDTVKDFTPIIHVAGYVHPLLVMEDKPWKTLKELVESARKNPGGIKVGIGGSKYTQVEGILVGRIEMKENIKFTYIPFPSGSKETMTALLGGHVDVYAVTLDNVSKDYIDMGKARILAYISKNKIPEYDKILSTQEIYGFSVSNLMGMVGPKGLPLYVRKKLEDAFTKGMKDPSFVSIMKKMETSIIYMTGEEMAKYIEKTYKEQGEVMKQMKAEELKK